MKSFRILLASLLLTTTPAFAQIILYDDVPAGAWFQQPVEEYAMRNLLDLTQDNFRPGDNATRAEFAKLLIELRGGLTVGLPETFGFSDVADDAWYKDYMEEMGMRGWMKGDGDCYKPMQTKEEMEEDDEEETGTGETVIVDTCFGRPNDPISRAEASALIVRAFNLLPTAFHPGFTDVPLDAWYSGPVLTAADYCILQGDDEDQSVRPGDTLNRAEMIAMLNRSEKQLLYGQDCLIGGTTDFTELIEDDPGPQYIAQVFAGATDRLEVLFNTAVDAETLSNDFFFIAGDNNPSVTSARLLDELTVELTISPDMDPDGKYTLVIEELPMTNGEVWNEEIQFMLPEDLEVEEEKDSLSATFIEDVFMPSSESVEVKFVNPISGEVSVKNLVIKHGIINVPILSYQQFGNDTIILELERPLPPSTTYEFQMKSFLTQAGERITISKHFRTFTPIIQAEHIVEIARASLDAESINVGPGAIEIVAGKIAITSSCIDRTEILALSLTYEGNGTSDDIDQLYLRLVDGEVNASTTSIAPKTTLTFSEPFTLEACEGKTLEVLVDLDPEAPTGTMHRFDFVSAADALTQEEVLGNFPVKGVEINVVE